MRAELKSLFSMEIPAGLEKYSPADRENFGISIQAFIGSAGSDAADSFDIVVCTPRWFSEHFDDPRFRSQSWEPPGVRFGNRCLFVRRWDYDVLRKAISDLCADQEAADWGGLANRIGRHIPWEFDYRYDDFLDEASSRHGVFPPEKQP